MSSAFNDYDTCWVKKDICGVDYLATRLAKVELLLDARDSRLHPGILDVTRRIHEGKSSPSLFMIRKRAHCHSEICQRKAQSSSLRTGDDIKPRIRKQKTPVFRVRRRSRQMLELLRGLCYWYGVGLFKRQGLYCHADPAHADAYELEEGVEELREPVSRTLVVLCRNLFEPGEFGACMLSMQCISMVMQTYVRTTEFTRAI